MAKSKIIFIVGPTATGKTNVAFHLAQKINGEIISCDSMQVYKEITILSAKPAKTYLKKIPHHLINILSVKDEFDVARFRRRAVRAIGVIHRKKKIPIIVGGSGMYMSILLDGIFKGPSRRDKWRKKLERQAAQEGIDTLYATLKEKDQKAASKIHPNDKKRIIRALEVILSTKKPISVLQKKREGLWGKYDIDIFALNTPRDKLYRAINNRVERMMDQGAADELKKLCKRKWSQTAKGLIGIKEMMEFFDGQYDLKRAVYLIQLNTRHFAKRQLTWFRRDKRLKWIGTSRYRDSGKIAEHIIKEANL